MIISANPCGLKFAMPLLRIVLVGVFALIATNLYSQVLVDRFSDDSGNKKHLTIKEQIADGRSAFIWGDAKYDCFLNQRECSWASYVMRVDEDGDMVWSTLDFQAQWDSPNRIIRDVAIVDEFMYICGHLGEFNGDEPSLLTLTRMNKETGAVEWHRTYNNWQHKVGGTATKTSIIRYPDGRLFLVFEATDYPAEGRRTVVGLVINQNNGNILGWHNFATVGGIIAEVDESGKIVYGSDNALTCLDNLDAGFSQLWFNAIDVPRGAASVRIEDVFVETNNRLFIQSRNHGFVEINHATGNIIKPADFPPQFGNYTVTSKIIRWPFVYSFSGIEVRKHSLASLEELWCRRIEFPLFNTAIATFAYNEEQDLLTLIGSAGLLQGADDDFGRFYIAELDEASGDVRNSYLQSSRDTIPEYHFGTDIQAYWIGNTSRWFYHYRDRQLETNELVLYEIAANLQGYQSVNSYTSQEKFDSYVLKTLHNNSGRLLELRQVGPVWQLRQYADDLTVDWSASPDLVAHTSKAFDVAINARGEIAVISEPLPNPAHLRESEGLPVSEYHIFDSNGRLIKRHQLDSSSFDWYNAELTAFNNDFFVVRRRLWSRIPTGFVSGFNTDAFWETGVFGSLDRWIRTRPQHHKRLLVQDGNLYFLSGREHKDSNFVWIYKYQSASRQFEEHLKVDFAIDVEDLKIWNDKMVVLSFTRPRGFDVGKSQIRVYDNPASEPLWTYASPTNVNKSLHSINIEVSSGGDVYYCGVESEWSPFNYEHWYLNVSKFNIETGDVDWTVLIDREREDSVVTIPQRFVLDEQGQNLYVAGQVRKYLNRSLDSNDVVYVISADGQNTSRLSGHPIPLDINDLSVGNGGSVVVAGNSFLDGNYYSEGIMTSLRAGEGIAGNDDHNPLGARFYPNPVGPQLTVDFAGELDTEYSVEVQDILGNLHSRRNIMAESGTVTVQLDLRSLAIGMYFVRISGQDETSVLKFIKQ